MRVSGMVSGMDTDSIVADLMRVERMKVDRYSQKKQVNLWRQEEYQKINKNLANFILNSQQNMGLKKKGSTGILVNQSYKTLDYLKMVESSNTDYVDVKLRGKSANGSFQVQVEQLAKSAYFTSDKIDINEELEGDIKVGDTLVHKASDGPIKLRDLIKKINSNEDMKKRNVSAFYERGSIFLNGDYKNGTSLKISTGSMESVVSDKLTLDYIKDLNLEGVEIEKLEDVMKLGQDKQDLIRDAILEKEGIISTSDDYFAFSLDGEQGEKTLSLNQFKGRNLAEKISDAGQAARVRINGVTIDSNSNLVEFNGVEISLKKTTLGEDGNHIPINIRVDTNYDGVMDKIKEIVADYNSMLDEIAKVIGEERYQGYHPLSNDEKQALNDEDVKLWQEKARSGMLNNDESLNRMLSKMRLDMYKTVEGLEGSFKHMTEIGITTQKYSRGTTGGKLEINEEKLYQALEKDTEGVMELLFGKGELDPDNTEPENRRTDKGIFTGIYDNMIDGMKEIINKSGPGEDSDLLRDVKSNILIDFVSYKGSISDIDRDIMSYEKSIQDLERLLMKKEDAYYAKFTTMEQYMYDMFSQSNWLSQQMGMY